MSLKRVRELIDQERFEEARAPLQEFVSSDPASGEGNYLLGLCLDLLAREREVDYERVRIHYAIALASHWNDFWVLYARGNLEMKLGRFDAAAEDFTSALNANVDRPESEVVAATRKTIDQLLLSLDSLRGDESSVVTNPVVAIAVPKCGTMLLHGVLSALVGERCVIPNPRFDIGLVTNTYLRQAELHRRVYVGHVAYEADLAQRLRNVRKIVLVRDPRDYVVSQAHFLPHAKSTDGNWQAQWAHHLEGLQHEERISGFILGMSTRHALMPAVDEVFRQYALGWLDEQSLLIRYEDLVDERFGGRRERALETARKIARHIGLTLSDTDIEERLTAGSEPARSGTFRRGGSGAWKQEFSPRNRRQFSLMGTEIARALGYIQSEIADRASLQDLAFAHPRRPAQVLQKQRALLRLAGDQTQQRLLALGWGANSLVGSGANREALSALDALIELEPHNPRWLYLRGFARHILRGQVAKDARALAAMARDDYTQALSRGYDQSWTYYHRGLLNAEEGLFTEASNDLRSAIDYEGGAASKAAALALERLPRPRGADSSVAPSSARGAPKDGDREALYAAPQPAFSLQWLEASSVPQSMQFMIDLLPAIRWLTRHWSAGKPMEVLDVGTSSAAGANLLASLYRGGMFDPAFEMKVEALDIVDTYQRYASTMFPLVSYHVGDIFQWEPERTWDLVICSHTIEHMVDPTEFISHVQRRARHWAIFYAPFDEKNLLPGHLRAIDAKFVRSLKPIVAYVLDSPAWRHPIDMESRCVVFALPGHQHTIETNNGPEEHGLDALPVFNTSVDALLSMTRAVDRVRPNEFAVGADQPPSESHLR